MLVQLVGALPTLAVTAAGSVLSALALSRTPEAPVVARNRSGSARREAAEGLRFLQRDLVLSGMLGFSALANLFAQWVSLLFLIDAVRRLRLSTAQIGLVLAVGAVGTLLGAGTGPAVARRVGALRTILLTATLDPLVLFSLPAATPGWGTAVLLVGFGAAFAVNGYAVGVDTVVVMTLRQIRTPDALRGRVNAATRAISYGTIALGAALGGLLSQTVGVRAGLLMGCLGALSTIVWVAGWAVLLTRSGARREGNPATRPIDEWHRSVSSSGQGSG